MRQHTTADGRPVSNIIQLGDGTGHHATAHAPVYTPQQGRPPRRTPSLVRDRVCLTDSEFWLFVYHNGLCNISYQHERKIQLVRGYRELYNRAVMIPGHGRQLAHAIADDMTERLWPLVAAARSTTAGQGGDK